MEEKQSKTSRQLIEELLTALHPELDMSDEETLFATIYDDYEEYAKMIESREADLLKAEAAGEIKGRNAKIDEIMKDYDATDGVPLLKGANMPATHHSSSIFDVAAFKY